MLLVLLPLGVALVVVSVFGLAGFGPLTADRRAERDGGLRAIGPAVGLLAGIGVIALTLVATIGLAGVDGDDDLAGEERADRSEREPTTTTSMPSTTGRSRPTRRISALGPKITVEADEGRSFPQSYDVADHLEPVTVLQVWARGFDSFGRAIVEQCGRVGAANACFNPLPVQLDADGGAHFQYLITTEFVHGRSPRGTCRAAAAPCTVVVRSVTGSARGEVQTIFGDEISPPGEITVTPATELSLEGGQVTVEVRDYPPGARVTAMLCAAPDASGPGCGAPGPTAPLVVGRDGRGSTELVIRPGPVGSRGTRCARGDDCGVTVISDDVFARAPVVPISFAAPPGADYDPTRLVLGLAVATILAGIASWLILRTDWSAVGEAAAPEIDGAEYADLDAIVAALPPEEDELVGAT